MSVAKSPKTVWIKNFFVFEFINFKPAALKKAAFIGPSSTGCFEGPVMRSFDRYNDIERIAALRIQFYGADNNDKHADFDVIINPPVVNKTCHLYTNYNTTDKGSSIQGDYSYVRFCVNIEVPIGVFKPPVNPLGNKMKAMFSKDPAAKFIIRCHGNLIEGIKPILAACSPVFEAMFKSGMEESKNSVMEIRDFEPEVVEKMVEFCETDEIADFEGDEVELFKIAHKYQIHDLMKHAMQEIVKTTTKENRCARYSLAEAYGLEDFKKWFSNF